MNANIDTLEYPARIRKQRDGGYLVVFPDLPGCVTEGNTLEDALQEAKEALSGWLYVAIKEEEDIPRPSALQGRSLYGVAPDLDVAVPLSILWARKRRQLTQKQLAKTLGISQQAYRKFETPGTSNLTIKTLGRLSEVLGIQLVLRTAA